jgi:hypothetical protein
LEIPLKYWQTVMQIHHRARLAIDPLCHMTCIIGT